MIIFQDIINKYDPDTDGEIKAVTKTGKLIAKRLNEQYWMRWTKFPDEFASCRTDADLYQTIDNYNRWIKDAEKYFWESLMSRLRKMPSELTIEDEESDESE